MPTYEYECGECGHRLEMFQSMSDKPLKKCPECNKPKLSRLIGSGAGIIFKGSGFYETDYKRAASKPSSESSADSSTPAPASASSSDKKDSTTPKKDSGGSKAAS